MSAVLVNPSLDLDDLSVMQAGLRDLSQLPEMIQAVRNGSFWTTDFLQAFAAAKGLKKPPLIEIAEFPDGRRMIHDGHHRCVATWLGGRTYLRGDEFYIKRWQYENYNRINLSAGWVTPFDPRFEVRVPDFKAFKDQALSFSDEKDAVQFILKNKKMYARLRSVSGLEALAGTFSILSEGTSDYADAILSENFGCH